MMAELLDLSQWGQYLFRLGFFCTALGFIFLLGKFRSEWRSRKVIISWMWTMLAIDTTLMNGTFAESKTAMIITIGAVVIIIIHLIGDRVEAVKFKEFEVRLDANDKSKTDVDSGEDVS